ncbi:hypothetical protein VTH82DRAFT_268 [Thermothelomyces myriococcoides]
MDSATMTMGTPAGGPPGRSGTPFGSPGRMSPPDAQSVVMPTGKALVEGYRKDMVSGFGQDKATSSNPLNENRPQRSAHVDLKDPIQVHLLTETALSDSKTYEILSQEEVDDLKKQIQSLSMRIEQARANLAIQTKYRDAAVSMARLYTPSKAEGKRRSLLGNRMSDSAKEAEMERLASERRCEELAAELFMLEKRLMEPQKRLLQHTAGILQMTHRASAKKSGQVPVGPMMNGIPGSPESLYTYTNTRNSLEIPHDDFNFDRSLYLPLEQANGPPGPPQKTPIEIPLKSPIREQNAQLRELREEVQKLKEENERILEENMQLKTAEKQLREDQAFAKDEISRLQSREQQLVEEHARAVEETSRYKDADSRLKALENQMTVEIDALRAQTASQLQAASDAEAKLEVLNHKLRDMIVAFNPTKNEGFDSPPDRADGSGVSLTGQLEYMEKALAVAAEEQQLLAAEVSASSSETAALTSSLHHLETSLDQAGERSQALIRRVLDMLQQSNLDLPQPPPSPEDSLDDQFGYLEQAIESLGSELSRALEASSSASARKQDIDQVDAVLRGLWEIIQSGSAEMEQQRAARRQNRALGQNGGDDDEELSSNEFEGDFNEPYSLQAFSAKVQWLYTQVTSLREQKYILQRQIKQQRELNNRSESEKDLELKAKSEELERTQHLLDEAERAAADAQSQLEQVLADMDTLQKTTAANEAALAASTKTAQDQLQARTARIAALEADVREAESRLATAEASVAATQSQLAESNNARAAAEDELNSLRTQLTNATAATESVKAEVSKLQQELQAKDEELDRMNMMVVELKTEVTVAKAELDGAYGSRKQRAAEAAALTNSSQSEELNNTITRLRAELENALRDLEEVTRDSIAAEKDRLEIEGRLDRVLAQKDDLEAEVGRLGDRLMRLQEELDQERLKAVPSPGGRAGAGASELSKQFRGMMKEERRKFQEELREEQVKRRKLEDELRALRRGQGASTASFARGTLSPR